VAAWPHIWEIAWNGLDRALAESSALRRGVATQDGRLVNPALAASMNAQGAAR
jgi:alanine dehydrogenase